MNSRGARPKLHGLTGCLQPAERACAIDERDTRHQKHFRRNTVLSPNAFAPPLRNAAFQRRKVAPIDADTVDTLTFRRPSAWMHGARTRCCSSSCAVSEGRRLIAFRIKDQNITYAVVKNSTQERLEEIRFALSSVVFAHFRFWGQSRFKCKHDRGLYFKQVCSRAAILIRR